MVKTKNKIGMDKLKATVIAVLEDKTEMVHFIDDIFHQKKYPYSKQVFYDYKLHEDPDIQELILRNKRLIKEGLRRKWYKAGLPTTDIVLYKLIGTEEERLVLNNQTITHEGGKTPIKIERMFD